MITVIMAGGKGTRISSVASDIPKPMIEIESKPVLEHEIECLREQGFTDILITVSHLGNIIMDYFGDGAEFGVNISYYFEKEPLGNAGALFKVKDQLTDDFLLLNADAMFDIDFNRFVDYHYSHGGIATLFTHPNSHPYDSGVIVADDNHRVLNWLSKEDERPEYYKNRVNAGLHVLSKKILDVKVDKEKIDLDRDLLKPLAGTGKMYCYDSPEYVKDMGTPDRYYGVCEDYRNGIIKARNLRNKQKAVFLDRDGTINKYVGFLTDIKKLELIDGAAEAIKKINESGYLAIVVTNQPVIARGEVYGRENDVFLGISTSGNSKNILYAAVVAKAKGMKVVALTGEKDSKLSKIADVTIKAPQSRTYMIQEYHLPIYHCLRHCVHSSTVWYWK